VAWAGAVAAASAVAVAAAGGGERGRGYLYKWGLRFLYSFSVKSNFIRLSRLKDCDTLKININETTIIIKLQKIHTQ
jgi:hypothetical protein